jgi:hypothetical protein
MPYPVQNLIEGRGEPVGVQPHDSVQEALRLMIEHDFSQLPVVDEEQRPLGIVTYEAILRALNNFGVKIEDLLVSNAMTTRVQKYHPEDDLFDLLDRLKETNAVLIVDGEDNLIGIVTSYDSNEYFRRRAEDMMLVEDIEGMVKDLVQAAFMGDTGEVDHERLAVAIEDITSSKRDLLKRYKEALVEYLKLQAQGQPSIDPQAVEESFVALVPKEKPKEFDDLTLYEFTELLVHKDRWSFYQPLFNLEPDALRKLLDEVRQTRNTLAHFRGDISPTQRDQLKFCVDWLAKYSVDDLTQQLEGIPVTWPVPAPERPREPQVMRESGMTYQMATDSAGDVAPTDEVLGPSDSRYAPLAIYLNGQPSSQDRVQLRFVQIEDIIDGDLPLSARQHRSWWANDSVSHIQSQQWLDVGWRVGQISMTEQRVTFVRIKERERAHIDFFSALQGRLRQTKKFQVKPISPDGQSWLVAASLPEGGPQSLFFNFSFARNKHLRVELYIDTIDQEKNKYIFDQLYAKRDDLERVMGVELSWERLSDKRASRIALYHPGAITNDEKTLAHLRDWAADAMVGLYETLAEPAQKALISAEQSGA